MKKNWITTVFIFVFIVFLLGSCQPHVEFSWRLLGWRCRTGV